MSGSTVLRQVNHTMRVSGVKPEHIWAVYKNVANWNQWNKGIATSSIDGEFVTGNTFKMKLQGPAPELTATLTEVVENSLFNDSTPTPFGTVEGSHRITQDGDELEIYHEIKCNVVEAELGFFNENVFPGWERGIPHEVAGVIELAKVIASGSTPFASTESKEGEEATATPA